GVLAVVTVEPNLDFGDAPDPLYPTLLGSDGARHVVLKSGASLYLGLVPPDSETEGQQSANANGDNSSGINDEDGISFGGNIGAGQPYTVTIRVTGAGVLNAWIDWNLNGTWNDGGEQILTNIVLANESKVLTLIAPNFTAAGQAFARFR